MKVIDLLNKIANGEEVPYRIMLKSGIVLFYEPDTKNYYNDLGCNELFNSWIADKLNDEVEVIEEDKKIKKLNYRWEETKDGYEICDEELVNKINEIIDVVNELKEGE